MSSDSGRLHSSVPVIDLFAGPGGLGEGFAAYDKSATRFEIKLSIEKDTNAHKTLRLRSFFRQFPRGKAPSDYYRYIHGHLSFDELSAEHSELMRTADEIAWKAELGSVEQNHVDSRIRHVLPDGKDWVLIGGPPCQAYSIAGRSRMSKVWCDNPEKKNSDKRHFLYREYLRIIGKHSPALFVMENVKGILTATVNGLNIFESILKDLKDPCSAIDLRSGRRPSYRLFSFTTDRSVKQEDLFNNKPCDPREFIIKAEDYGIPQKRHRVIILGVREDVNVLPDTLSKMHGELTVGHAIDDLPALRSSLSRNYGSVNDWQTAIKETASMCNDTDPGLSDALYSCMEKHMRKLGVKSIRPSVPSLEAFSEYRRFVVNDPSMEYPCNHEPRSHMPSDLQRYFFAACFAEVTAKSPVLRNFPRRLLPEHRNVDEGIRHSKFADRFRVQIKDKPSTTITCHISKDGHYYIHPDPQQCRSLSVREAARLQTFPDNYFFEGNRTSQYVQVGNAVPPLLAYKLAGIVAGILEKIGD